jgi:hypothetical protein
MLIATLLQHLTALYKNHLPDLQEGFVWSWQHASMMGNFALLLSKIACFCGPDRTRTCDLADVNGAF